MEEELVEYLINYFLYLIPLEEKCNLKYPYLTEKEREEKKIRIATLLLKNYSHNIFFNNCTNCGKLARTPNAKQCRFCGYDWR